MTRVASILGAIIKAVLRWCIFVILVGGLAWLLLFWRAA